MMLGYQLSLDQYNILKDSNLGDKIAILDYWDDDDDEDNTNMIDQHIHLQYGNFVIKTNVLKQLKNCKSELPLYEIRSNYRDEPYQSIELEIIDICKPENNDKLKQEITEFQCDYYGSEEFAMYNRITKSKFKYNY